MAWYTILDRVVGFFSFERIFVMSLMLTKVTILHSRKTYCHLGYRIALMDAGGGGLQSTSAYVKYVTTTVTVGFCNATDT